MGVYDPVFGIDRRQRAPFSFALDLTSAHRARYDFPRVEKEGVLMHWCRFVQVWTLALVVLLGGSLIISGAGGRAVAAPPQQIATVNVTPSFIEWRPHIGYESLTLRVALPDGGQVFQSEFRQGQSVAFDLVGNFPDGLYTYELVVTPRLDQGVKKALANSRKTGDASVIGDLQRRGVVPRTAVTQTGYFTVAHGSIVLPTEEE